MKKGLSGEKLIVIDSDVLIEIMDKKSDKGKQVFQRISECGEELFVPAIALHEVMFGLRKRGRQATADELLSLPVLAYNREDAILSSEIEFKLEKKGLPIERTDIMIAATTINNCALLCSFNIKHFKPLESLGLEFFP